ncbi:CST complex subunit STN1 isoform X2 [Zootoca vivipara]|uniref:CST complex subunit STN1 isoform X2 n=1 Tax=Zootoca vivipara TaxID=8524 RepID=UPI00293BFDFE|nr:CST complex subunit STN1 isoform X2 [Zootoca vivipara]
MFAAATESEEEVPSLLWGLDPIFSAFARLYIKDLQEMKESKQVPGIFFYNRHPIRQVDILGTVVLIKERDVFYTYGDFRSHPSTSSDLDLVEQIRKLQEAICQKTRLKIGDTIRVRGCIQIFRQQREIKASMYYKVDDPMCEVLISRMLELPRLYRDIYDQPFQLQEEAQSQDAAYMLGSITELSKKIRDFLLKNKIQSFYQQELETVEALVSLVKEDEPRTAEQTDSKAGPSSKLIRDSFTEAIKVLQNKGVLFQKSKNPKDMYFVTEQDKELHKVTLEVLRDDCKRPKYAEKGCHLNYILNCIQQSYSPFVSKAVIHCLLDWMETNSDVVTTMEGYYTVF